MGIQKVVYGGKKIQAEVTNNMKKLLRDRCLELDLLESEYIRMLIRQDLVKPTNEVRR